jgi:hypothetical protein
METSPPGTHSGAYTHAQTERDVPPELRAQRLSAALDTWRTRRGEEWSEVAKGAGVTEASLRNLRTKGSMPRVKTIAGLEEHFGWSGGSVLAIINGDEPTPKNAQATEPLPPQGKGFRWTVRSDGVTDYYLTFELDDQPVDLRIADLHGEGREAVHERLLAIKKRALGLQP